MQHADPCKIICGVDEAGRGPLAGPVYAACVILDKNYHIAGLNDSKKLSALKRSMLATTIKQYAKAWAVASASVDEIDRMNILQASLLAMKRAVEGLSCVPDQVLVLVDGKQCPDVPYPVQAIVRGDSLIPEISAASILAKTERDIEMLRLHSDYPHYGFDRHKGYPTSKHLAALQQYGPSEIHRKSFAPVSSLIFNH
ncbi:RNase HII [Nitrosomonas sp. PY1]|uniref:ribonuclease HII n=1 Tax=Nitrosomonas sp. PY1 TaxID=1803906 RepID=UPI001FC7D9B7|nr:ribonuclease HII [Nitrosomonas sp. PY1]GKS68701.1 RNase HII [Nitrosomonas sp. PY1]